MRIYLIRDENDRDAFACSTDVTGQKHSLRIAIQTFRQWTFRSIYELRRQQLREGQAGEVH